MLILTRRVGETICIGDDITVTVMAINGNQVILGTSAPRDVSIHREEVYARIQAEARLPSSQPVPRASKRLMRGVRFGGLRHVR